MHIHAIAQEAPDFFRQIFKCLQEDPKMVMQVGDVLIIDEHIIPHTSKDIEGVEMCSLAGGTSSTLGRTARFPGWRAGVQRYRRRAP